MFSEKEFYVGLVSISIYVAGSIPYIVSIVRRNSRPHRISMGIFTIVGTIAFVNQVKNGGGYSSLFSGASAAIVIISFALSFKYGMGGKTKLDLCCLSGALLLMAFWLASSETRTTTVLAILIDVVAITPTLAKVYKHPETEIYWTWVVIGISALISVFAVPNSDWILYAWPIYIFFGNLSVAAAKYFGNRKLGMRTT